MSVNVGLEAIRNMEACYDSVDDLLSGLDHDQWRVQSYCPDWDTRGVVMHLGGAESMMSGAAPGSFTDTVPFPKVAEFIGRTADLDDADLLAAYREVIAIRRNEIAAVTEDQMALPSLTPVGPSTYGHFMAIRVFDFWTHEQDMRGPLGIPGHAAGPAAEMAMDEIERSLGYIIGKRVGLPDGKSITIELTGPVQRTMHVAVDGRAARVDSLDNPDVVLTADSLTFAMLACGRIDPQGPIDTGAISWTGDAEWGERAARSLRFTM